MNFKDNDLNRINRLFNQIAAGVYGLQRENLEATTFVPRMTGVNEWAGSVTVKKISELGIAKLISDYAEDLPPVSRAMSLETVQVKEYACSYGYSEMELMQWLTTGIDLQRDEADTARRKIDEKVDDVILVGDSAAGLPGFLNNANVGTVAIPAGAAGTTEWSSKTIGEIVADIQAMIDAVRTYSRKTVRPDSLLIPHAAYVHLATAQRDANSDQTMLEYLQKVFRSQGIVNFDECGKLEGIGAEGKDRAVLYKRDASCVAYVLPVPFRQKEPQEHALHYSVPCYARVGGTVIKNIASVVYADGV